MKKIINNNLFNQNCYILEIDQKLVVIDPGDNYESIKSYLDNKKIDLILITHHHFDHIGSVNKLCKEFNVKAYVHQEGFELVQKDSSLPFNLNYDFEPVIKEYLQVFTNKIAELPSLKIFHAPGHSPDSTLFLFENQLFTGDVLFANGYGRVDLPYSNSKKMQESLQQFFNFDSKIIINPGHGPSIKLELLKSSLQKFINDLS